VLFRTRRSVAPVIATLLMVAIAVVGGMLVFVFAQDFFTQTDSMTGPTIEQVQMYGYDARDLDTSKIENHEGDQCLGVGAVGGTLADGDIFALYIRNLGNQPIVVNEVNVFGTGATPADGTVLSATDPEAGEFTVVLTDDCNNATASPNLAVLAGQDATILVAYSSGTGDTFGDDVKVGRPIFVSIETAGGNIFTKNIISGRSVG